MPRDLTEYPNTSVGTQEEYAAIVACVLAPTKSTTCNISFQFHAVMISN